MMTLSNISRRRILQWMTAQVAAVSIDPTIAEVTSPRPPNVVFLLSDDVGYGDLACLGNPVIKTPNFDALHADSVRFTDFHVSPTCAPSRASLMTGRYSNATGVWHTINGRSLLDPSNITMAQCFKSSGYTTGIFGKWHLGDNYPCRTIDLGFDESVVCGGGGIWQTPDYFGNDDRNDAYLHNGVYEKYLGFSTDIFFDRAMDFMGHAQNRHQPFFCYIPTPAAHDPVWALQQDSSPYLNVPGLSKPGFYGMIANIDSNLGRLRKFLESRGLTENTILIYAGDNGSEDGIHVFNAGMRSGKVSPYDGGHRVPLFISWPAGKLTGGNDVSTLSAHIDLLPTLTDVCQLKLRGKDVDGRSLRPLLYGKGADWQPRVIVTDSQREEYLVKWKDAVVMTQRWRLVSPTADGDQSRIELYDILQDPGQKVDVAARYPKVVRQLKGEYETWWAHTSVDRSKVVRIVLGNSRENPSKMTCMDWHGDGAAHVWNQKQIRTGPVANGYWAVDIDRAGRYRFELRRWPRELDYAINAAYTNPLPNMETTPGVAISAVQAGLKIANVHETKPVQSGDKYAEFVVTLPKGKAELQTVFYGADGTERGAYYLYAERL